MMSVSSSAPGKIIVAGEYAVLLGAPAICIAVNRRARVSIRSAAAGTHSVSAPGYRQGEVQFENIADVADDQPVLAAVWKQFPNVTQQSLSIEIDTRRFFSGDCKLGIGSSAAATVALGGAFGVIARQDCEGDQQAHAAHRLLQNGRGSGADVASSYHGGVIEYRMRTAAPGRLTWPKHLHYALLWSGQSSSTAAQLQKLVEQRKSAASDALVAAAEAVSVAWITGTAESILVGLREYGEALRRYDDEYQLDIYAAGHADIADRAVEHGVVYKPCGAGGGDYGMAVAEDEQLLRGFVAIAEEQGFAHSDLRLEPVGLVVEQDSQ